MVGVGRVKRMAFADWTADNVASAICILRNFMAPTMTTVNRRTLKHIKIIDVMDRNALPVDDWNQFIY